MLVISSMYLINVSTKSTFSYNFQMSCLNALMTSTIHHLSRIQADFETKFFLQLHTIILSLFLFMIHNSLFFYVLNHVYSFCTIIIKDIFHYMHYEYMVIQGILYNYLYLKYILLLILVLVLYQFFSKHQFIGKKYFFKFIPQRLFQVHISVLVIYGSLTFLSSY